MLQSGRGKASFPALRASFPVCHKWYEAGDASFLCPCHHTADKGQGQLSRAHVFRASLFASLQQGLALLCCPGEVWDLLSQVVQSVRSGANSPALLPLVPSRLLASPTFPQIPLPGPTLLCYPDEVLGMCGACSSKWLCRLLISTGFSPQVHLQSHLSTVDETLGLTFSIIFAPHTLFFLTLHHISIHCTGTYLRAWGWYLAVSLSLPRATGSWVGGKPRCLQ